MANPQAIVSFGSIVDIESAHFLLLRGVQPSRGTITTPTVSQTAPEIADFVIEFDGKTLSLTGCAVQETHVDMGSRGQTLVVTFADRRWRWRYSDITGRYNVRQESGAILDSIKYEKTPQELLALLADALGETIDDTDLPNDARPEVDWRRARVDLELAELLGQLGCDIAPDLSTGNFRVVKIGEGELLPGPPTYPWIEHAGYTIAARDNPDVIRAVAAPNRYQCTIVCEAVGQDTDGTWKPIEDLSYRPVNPDDAGWSVEDPDDMIGVTGTYTDPSTGQTRKKRELAEATVFRSYRIKEIYHDRGNPPVLWPIGFQEAIDSEDGPPELTAISQLLPILPVLNDTYVDPEDGLEKPKRPWVYASWFDSDFGEETDGMLLDVANNVLGARYPYGYSIDLEKGIIHFGQPVYRLHNVTRLVEQADVSLVCAVECDWVGLNQKVWYERSRLKDGVTEPERPMVIHCPDIALKYKDNAEDFIFTSTSNKTAVDAQLDYYLDAMEDRLIDQEGGTATYADLVAASPDGAIEQIEWVVDGQGMTTRIARFTQLDTFVPSWEDLQREARRQRLAPLR